jgi:hypothetical protein
MPERSVEASTSRRAAESRGGPPEDRVLVTRGEAPLTFRVSLEGSFPTGWAGALSLGLARAHVGIVSGLARKNAPRQWTAAFVVRPETAAADPERVPYLTLARRRQPLGTALPIVLESFSVEADGPSGALLLEVRGRDRTGFLGSLLDRLAGLALFPEDMTIETEGEMALDRFALKALGGATPSEEAQDALLTLLEDLKQA